MQAPALTMPFLLPLHCVRTDSGVVEALVLAEFLGKHTRGSM